MKLIADLLYYFVFAPLAWCVLGFVFVLWLLLVMPFVVVERAWRDSWR